jgi:hypothetical protein
LEMQPPRTPRRKRARNGGTAVVGTGETRLRPSSETPGAPLRVVAWEAASPISGVPVKRVSAERESERPIVPLMPWTTEPRRREGAVLGRCARRR